MAFIAPGAVVQLDCPNPLCGILLKIGAPSHTVTITREGPIVTPTVVCPACFQKFDCREGKTIKRGLFVGASLKVREDGSMEQGALFSDPNVRPAIRIHREDPATFEGPPSEMLAALEAPGPEPEPAASKPFKSRRGRSTSTIDPEPSPVYTPAEPE